MPLLLLKLGLCVPASVVQEGNGNTPAGSAVHVGHFGCKNGVFLRLEKIECRA